jgi:hypothetical protein
VNINVLGIFNLWSAKKEQVCQVQANMGEGMKYETIRRKQTADISQTSQGMGYSRAVQYRSGLSYLPGVQVEDYEDDFEDEMRCNK